MPLFFLVLEGQFVARSKCVEWGANTLLPMPPETRTLTIEKLVYGGDGLARDDGRVVLTPFVLPGEVVRAEVRRAKNDLGRGRILELLTAAGGRVEPGCPFFYRCGGCQYQHASYELQLQQKAAILREVLRRSGKIEFDGEIEILAAEPWQYRNRTQLHIRNGQAGYFAAGSHELCPIDQCPISSPRINAAIAALNRELPGYREFEATVELFTNETEIQVNVLDRVPRSVMPLFENLGTREPIEYAGFHVSRGSFFQVNRFLVDRLVNSAIQDARGEAAVDLYAGVGLFTRRLAQQFDRVHAVEPNEFAFNDLESNVGNNAVAYNMTAEVYLANLNETPDLILADPPRAGLGKTVVGQLLRYQPQRLVIVACDPATLARDLAILLTGGYRMEALTLVDLFPQTFHFETVVALAFKD